MNDSNQQGPDHGGNGPARGSRGNGKSSNARDNSTARTLQYSAMPCTACGLPINEGRHSKSTPGYTATCPMDGAIHTRLTPPIGQICLSLPQIAVPTTPESHEELASPPQSVPMQRGRAFYEPPCGQPPSTRGITVTAGPTAAPEHDAGGSFSGSDYAQSHSLGQVPANQLFHPVPRQLNSTANGFLDRYKNRVETIEGTPCNNSGLSSLPRFTSFLSNSTGVTAAYYREDQDDPNQVRLPPILSYRRSSSTEPLQQILTDTTTNRSEPTASSQQSL